MNHYTYILNSQKDNNFYVGYTKDLNQQDATKREKYFKTYLSRFYIKKRIKSYLTG